MIERPARQGLGLLLVLSMVACGSGDDDDAGGADAGNAVPASSCEEAVAQLCTRACECGGGTCVFALPTAGASYSWDTAGECTSFHRVVACGDTGYDWRACQAALPGTCAMVGTDTARRGLDTPAACADGVSP